MLIFEDIVNYLPPPILPSDAGVLPVHRMLQAEPVKVLFEASRQFARIDRQAVLGSNCDVMLLQLRHEQCSGDIERYQSRSNEPDHH